MMTQDLTDRTVHQVMQRLDGDRAVGSFNGYSSDPAIAPPVQYVVHTYHHPSQIVHPPNNVNVPKFNNNFTNGIVPPIQPQIFPTVVPEPMGEVKQAVAYPSTPVPVNQQPFPYGNYNYPPPQYGIFPNYVPYGQNFAPHPYPNPFLQPSYPQYNQAPQQPTTKVTSQYLAALKTLPKFSGLNGENIAKFLKDVIFEMKNLYFDDSQMARAIIYCTSGVARQFMEQWLDSQKPEARDDLELVKTTLLKQYQLQFDDQRLAYEAMQRTMRKGETIAEYGDALMSIYAKMTIPPEISTQKNQFLLNLPSKIRSFIGTMALSETLTLPLLIKRATDFDLFANDGVATKFNPTINVIEPANKPQQHHKDNQYRQNGGHYQKSNTHYKKVASNSNSAPKSPPNGSNSIAPAATKRSGYIEPDWKALPDLDFGTKLYCQYCNSTTHVLSKCFKLHPNVQSAVGNSSSTPLPSKQ